MDNLDNCFCKIFIVDSLCFKKITKHYQQNNDYFSFNFLNMLDYFSLTVIKMHSNVIIRQFNTSYVILLLHCE